MNPKTLTALAAGALAFGVAAGPVSAHAGHRSTETPTASASDDSTAATYPGDATGSSHGDAEQLLTGDTKTQAEAAALAAVPGGTVRRSSTEDPAEGTGAAYEVHVTKADGTEVEVLEDSSFTVLKVQTQGRHGGRHGHRHHGRGHGRGRGESGTSSGSSAGDYPSDSTTSSGV